jgi:uncharacterized membrane protein
VAAPSGLTSAAWQQRDPRGGETGIQREDRVDALVVGSTMAAGEAYPLGVPEVTYAFAVPYPPEVVFDFVADAENNPRWHEHVNETRWIDPPPIVVGRKARQTGHLFGRDWAFLAEVVEYDPPRRVVYRVLEGFKVRTAIDVEPDGAGGTRLRTTITTPRLPGPLDGLASRLLRRSTAKRARGDLTRLVTALEEVRPEHQPGLDPSRSRQLPP